MSEGSSAQGEGVSDDVQRTLEEIEYTGRKLDPRLAMLVSGIAFLWSMFQLWIASPLPSALMLIDVQKRGIHLGFALLLCFLLFPMRRQTAGARIPPYDIALALIGCLCALYLFLAYGGLVERQGVLLDIEFLGIIIPFEAILGGVGIAILLEATRRGIGLPLVIVAILFLLYSVFGQNVEIVIGILGVAFLVIGAVMLLRARMTFAGVMMGIGALVLLYAFFGETLPDILAHKGVSLTRLIGYQWLGGEAIFGIPIDVSVSFVFLFVLFGALLEKAGAGKYFLDLAFAMVGKYRGGPAKAAILASGMTGAISGSSIANVVTTGTFTIPVMRKTGIPAVKAGAIEVAASTNGQIMPPIMGAAAFIIAELVGISYFDVVVAAFIPAVISYLALLYISHLEALKLNLRGLPKADIPHLRRTFVSGVHFLIPIVVLIYLLMVERWTAGTAVFWSILVMMGIMVAQHLWAAFQGNGKNLGQAAWEGVVEVYDGMVTGARNMITIGIAVAAAGIIVGSVSSTGLNNAMVGVVEAISGGNVFVMLILTAVMCLILGMGLPTTANYLVVASLLAGVLVELGSASGLVLPLIAVHLYVFYFGILADDTPPVCLAAFAAAAISRADPIRTGLQGFAYDIRTAILPFVFLFNPELLLIGITSYWHGLLIFVVALLAMLSFAAATQGWMLIRATIVERVLLLVVVVCFFRPDFVLDQFSPAWEDLNLKKFVAGEVAIDPGRKTRVHAVRETDYGDRFKLYVLTAPPKEKGVGPAAFGAKFEPVQVKAGEERKGSYSLADMAPGGMAEKAGLDFGDYITGVSVERLGRPAKEWVYPLAFVILGFVIALQLTRRRRAQRGAAEEAAG
jgi:TRAP transporter 4TM/12TM fusion protein